MIKYKKGMTLTELLFVSLFLIFIIIAVVGIFNMSLRYVNLAREISLATDDLKDVLEKLKSVAFSDIMSIFPDGGSVSSGSVGGFLLTDENIVVNYPNGSGADPLEIEVVISWTSKVGGTRSAIIKTLRTRML